MVKKASSRYWLARSSIAAEHHPGAPGVQRRISASHCDFSDAGETTSTRSISSRRARSSAMPMPWIVLPRPMSSARIARPTSTEKAMPSSW